MAAKVVLLGRLEDVAGVNEWPLTGDGPWSWAQVLAALPRNLADAVQEPRIKVAINGTLLSDKLRLIVASGDELAFLPPVSGGGA